MNYFALKEDYNEENVYVSDIPEGLVRKYELLKGISRAKDWPAGLCAQFSDYRPDGVKLTDWIANPFGWVFISGAFKKLLQEHQIKNIEYLPIKIKDHEGQLASKEYWIINFLTHVEAVDRTQSIFEIDAAEKDKISRFDQLVLNKNVSSDETLIFRLKEQPRLVLVREDIVNEIKKAKFTGLKFTITSEYKTYDPND